MNEYIDGFVIPLPKNKVGDYQAMAETAAQIWMEHGALEVRECVAEDTDAKDMVPFPRLAGAGSEETVVFSWIRYRSREHRDAVNARVMADPRIQAMCPAEGQQAPFDCQRMAYGGFRTLVAH